MPYISKEKLSKALHVPRPVIEEAVRNAGIKPNGTTPTGQPSYWFDQEAVDKIIVHMKGKDRIPEDAEFVVQDDPACRRTIPADMRRLKEKGGGESPAEIPAAGPPAPARQDMAEAAAAKAMSEYGLPASALHFRYYKIGPNGPSFKGEHTEALTISEIEDEYGAGYFNIEEWRGDEEGQPARKVRTWRRFKVGDPDEKPDEEPDEEIEEEPEEAQERQGGLFDGSGAPAPAPAPAIDPLAMIAAFGEMQKKTLELLERREPREPARDPAEGWIGQVLTFMQKQSEEADKAHQRRMDEIDKKHEQEMTREREYLATLDRNGKELQSNLMSVADRERSMNEKFMLELRSSIADQRNAVREERDALRTERTKVMDDVEDFTRRLKESALGGSPIYGLIQHGLSEARNVAGQLLSLRTGGSPVGLVSGPAGDGTPQAEAGRSAPAPHAGGIFDEMQRSKMLQDFLTMVALAIASKQNPEDLADAFVGQVLGDPTGQAHLVYNFFASAPASTVVDRMRPPVEVADPMRSKDGEEYWRAFQVRLRFAMDMMRRQPVLQENVDAGQDEDDAGVEPETSEKSGNPVEPPPAQG
ncbi:MAG: hypothetical protein PHC52_00685 [Syntrophales bacterium]|nr:hypothetical protein [Syntrophales bacterium]